MSSRPTLSPTRAAWLVAAACLACASPAVLAQNPSHTDATVNVPTADPIEALPLEAGLDAAAAPVVTVPMTAWGGTNYNDKGPFQLFVAEYRVLFEVSGGVSAQNRAGYLFGRNYEGANVSVNYRLAGVDAQVMQRITDAAWADFQSRLAQAGVQLLPRATGAEAAGGLTGWVPASQPGAPMETTLGGDGSRRFHVYAPTGMQVYKRGLTGMAGMLGMSERIRMFEQRVDGLVVTHVIQIADVESSGNRSSILSREASVSYAPALSLGANAAAEQTLASMLGTVRAHHPKAPVPLEGRYARVVVEESFDTDKHAATAALNVVSRLAGFGGVNSKSTKVAFEADPGRFARAALGGLLGANRASVDALLRPVEPATAAAAAVSERAAEGAAPTGGSQTGM